MTARSNFSPALCTDVSSTFHYTYMPLQLMAYSDEESCSLLSAAKGKIASCTVRRQQQWNVGAGGTTELSNVNYILYYPQIWLVINYANLLSWKLAPFMWAFWVAYNKMNCVTMLCNPKVFELSKCDTRDEDSPLLESSSPTDLSLNERWMVAFTLSYNQPLGLSFCSSGTIWNSP